MKYDFDLEDKSKIRKKLILRILLILVEIILTVLLAYAITHYGLERMTVSGEYMSPTLLDGDEIMIDRMQYRVFSIRRNDIVVVQHNGSEHNYYTIERVIGMPGEKIRIEEGEVYINGKKLKEKYDFPKMENGGLALEEITIEEDEYFMLCDNRNECEDSRNANIGNVHKQNIIGKAWLRTNSLALISHINGYAKQKKSAKSDASSE
ncbi:MAG: signal peptidase I [Lachnospiraceae bacterium]|nr:signal peptidase I [Lachnospiraceae bacterium]